MQGMKCLADEGNPALMHMLADCMSQVACQTWGDMTRPRDDRWSAILQNMQQLITSQNPAQIEIGLVLFSKLTEWLELEDILQQNTGKMYEILVCCMDHNSRQVQIAACKASINFITVCLPFLSPCLSAATRAQLHSFPTV